MLKKEKKEEKNLFAFPFNPQQHCLFNCFRVPSSLE